MVIKLLKIIACVGLVLFLNSCDAPFPNDPNSTLKNIFNFKTITIGICHFVSPQEINLLTNLAQSLNAKIIWHKDTQENLYRGLEDHYINIVSCAIHPDSPWNKRLSFSIPYATSENKATSDVFALQKGENAWLKYVNEFIYDHKDIK